MLLVLAEEEPVDDVVDAIIREVEAWVSTAGH
jgi:hypothetical protein